MPQFETSTYLAQIFWMILCFFILWFAMSWFIIPKIDDIMEQRRRKIDGYIQKAEKTNKQALLSLEKYETAIKKAKEHANLTIKANHENLATEIAGQRVHNQQILEKKIADNEEIMQNKRKETLAAIDDISTILAVDILHKVGFENVTQDEIKPFANKE